MLVKLVATSMEPVRTANLKLEKIKDKKLLKYGKDIDFITRLSDKLFNTYNELEFFLERADVKKLDLIS